MIKVTPSFLVEFQNLFLFVLFEGIASKLVKKEKFINSGISKHLEFWKFNILKDEMYARVMKPYIEYWAWVFRMLVKINSSIKFCIVTRLLAN
jgi:hypothetical protein